ncbi:hypothetical protein SDC9_209669 [bioreactor metagenome]|uniref:Uncharacterized protein n=1 Tax=bioreactor metagenome TaxID=1076179 RepID=A0A645JQZ5_9ZZZZ
MRKVLFKPRDDELPRLFKHDAEGLRFFLKAFRTLDAQFCHQRAGFVVKPGMKNPAVPAADAKGRVRLFFQYADRRPILFRNFPRNGVSHRAGSDDQHIKIHYLLSSIR